jgi:type IV fimbrial biogenesis protein FimT
MKKQSGFTLTELLITLAAAGVLASMAIPSFRTTIQNGRLVTQANDILGSLVYARSQAVTTARNITVCSSTDLSTCSTSNAWASGWIVCQEADAKTTSIGCATGSSVLRVHEALVGSNTLTNGSSLKSITFAPPSGSLTTGTGLYFDVCDSRGASYGRAIYIYQQGIARVSTTIGKQLDTTTAITC